MIKHKVIELSTKSGQETFINVTDFARQFVEETGVLDGILSVQTPHTTCSVFFEELVFDQDFKGHEYMQVDLIRGLSKIFPRQETELSPYAYPGEKHKNFAIENDKDVSNKLSYLLNGDAHQRATIVGASEVFSIIDGEIQTGPWGYIYFVDWDVRRARERKCILPC